MVHILVRSGATDESLEQVRNAAPDGERLEPMQPELRHPLVAAGASNDVQRRTDDDRAGRRDFANHRSRPLKPGVLLEQRILDPHCDLLIGGSDRDRQRREARKRDQIEAGEQRLRPDRFGRGGLRSRVRGGSGGHHQPNDDRERSDPGDS
jgi:hypothetical protein